MDNKLRDKLHKKDILTIPNLLSFFRLLLIPAIVILYTCYQQYIGAVLVILLSGLTDIADGRIARKYNMISDFGKFLDPLADKVTQAAMILCLMSKYKAMTYLIILMVLKETFLFILSYITFKKTCMVNGAKWYGKATTAILYGVMIILFLFPNIYLELAQAMISICILAVLGSMFLYSRLFLGVLTSQQT